MALALGAPARAEQAEGAPMGGAVPVESAASVPLRGESARAVRVFTDASGRNCEIHARQVVIDNTPQTAYATLCRQPDGRWVLVR